MSGKMPRLFVMDVDGTLTDGRINIGENGEIFKAFYVRDGYAIRHILPEVGVTAAIITGRASGIVKYRADELKIPYVYQDVHDKGAALRELQTRIGVSMNETAYIGDDVNDLPAMALSSLTACPADAVQEVCSVCDYVCKAPGGRGAVREFIEWIIRQD